MTPKNIEELLHWLRPGGFVPLSALSPDGTFWTHTPSDYAAAEQWALKTNKTASVYFALNPTREPMEKNAEKTDVARAEWLHIDVDPRSAEDRDAERARILALLTINRPANVPAPTLLWDSGNGYQAAWRLREPVELNGDAAAIEAVESRNRWLEKVFQADSCHNINRVLRLPFTINRPTKKKAAKGRIAAPSVVIEYEPTRTYALDDFGQVAAFTSSGVNKKPPSGTKAQRPPLHLGDGSGLDVAGLTAWATDNGKTIKDGTLALIATGDHPTEPGRYGSRSEPLFRACCDLVRADVPDDVIFRVITGPNAIAASVKDKPNPTAYATRQIERAHDEAVSPALRELNDRHFVVMADGDKTRVITQMDDPTAKRIKLVSQSFADINNYYANRAEIVGMKGDKPLTIPLGKFWLTHPLRRSYHAMYFDPGKNGEGRDVPGQYNLWRGWAVAPKPGDWSKMRAHIRNVLASGNPEYDDYIVKWAAWAVQNPDKQAETALVFRGARGAGKGVFGSALKNLFGRHGLQIFSPSQVTGKFNAHFLDCCLLFADESIIPGKDGGESQLKGLITETQLPIEKKGRDITTAANRLHVVMASNESWVVPAAPDERRFAVFDVDESQKQSKTYFAPLFAELDSGGLAAMLFDLLAMDLGDFHPRWNIPDTEALKRQKIQSLSGLDAYLYDLLCVGTFPEEIDKDGKPKKTATGVPFRSTYFLRDEATRWLRARHGEQHVSGNDVTELLVKLGATKYRRGGGGERGLLLPSLETMRAKWDALKFPVKWPTVAESETAPEQNELDVVPPTRGDDEKPPF